MNLRFVFVFIIVSATLFGTTYEYVHMDGDEESLRKVEITSFNDGYIVYTDTDKLQLTSVLDSNFRLIEQVSINKETKSESFIEIKENNIYYNGENIGSYKDGKTQPRGNIEFLGNWLDSKEKIMKFFVVSEKLDKEGKPVPGEMDKLELYLKKLGKENVVINGETIEAVKVLFTIDNKFLSMFWKNHYWYRASDGVLLKYESVKVPPGQTYKEGELKKSY